MMPTSVAATNRIYVCRENCSWTVHCTHHSGFRKFCFALTQLDQALGDEASADDFWRDWMRPLRRYRFDMSAAPLPFDHPEAILEEQLASLQAGVAECESLFPDYAPLARAVLEKLRSVVESRDNPILQLLTSLFPEDALHPAAILLKEPRLMPAAESVLNLHALLDGISLVSPQQLRGSACYAKLAVIGPARWFPDYVFMAPRARSIDVIQFDWISSRWEPSVSLASGAKAVVPTFNTVGAVPSLVEQGLNAMDVIPPVDWDAIAAASKARHAAEYNQEKVPARLFLLSGEVAVYLDADEQATATIIDAEQDGTAAVRRELVRRIEPGTYVLLRTEGGGDYIVPVADLIMGNQAMHARTLQSRWKDSLAEYVRRMGMQATCSALERRGATHANENNVRNWMNKRKIRPDADADFTAILRLVGLEADSGDYRTAMKLIDSAHQRAGQRIRELLLDQVDRADLEELHRLGRMDFELPDAGSGTLTAFRVEGNSQHTFPVPPSLLGRPFDSENRQWHE